MAHYSEMTNSSHIRADERIRGIFASAESLSTSATLPSVYPCFLLFLSWRKLFTFYSLCIKRQTALRRDNACKFATMSNYCIFVILSDSCNICQYLIFLQNLRVCQILLLSFTWVLSQLSLKVYQLKCTFFLPVILQSELGVVNDKLNIFTITIDINQHIWGLVQITCLAAAPSKGDS